MNFKREKKKKKMGAEDWPTDLDRDEYVWVVVWKFMFKGRSKVKRVGGLVGWGRGQDEG